MCGKEPVLDQHSVAPTTELYKESGQAPSRYEARHKLLIATSPTYKGNTPGTSTAGLLCLTFNH